MSDPIHQLYNNPGGIRNFSVYNYLNVPNGHFPPQKIEIYTQMHYIYTPLGSELFLKLNSACKINMWKKSEKKVKKQIKYHILAWRLI